MNYKLILNKYKYQILKVNYEQIGDNNANNDAEHIMPLCKTEE